MNKKEIARLTVFFAVWALIFAAICWVFFGRFGNPIPKTRNDICFWILVGIAYIVAGVAFYDLVIRPLFLHQADTTHQAIFPEKALEVAFLYLEICLLENRILWLFWLGDPYPQLLKTDLLELNIDKVKLKSLTEKHFKEERRQGFG